MSEKTPVAPSEMPKRCRTWDNKRRVWVPKVRYDSFTEAQTVAAPAKMRSYKCQDHFHIGHASGKR